MKLNNFKYQILIVHFINTKYKKYTDHFHNLLYKIMFVEKKTSFNFQGNKDDSRAYCNIDKFSSILLKNAFLKYIISVFF